VPEPQLSRNATTLGNGWCIHKIAPPPTSPLPPGYLRPPKSFLHSTSLTPTTITFLTPFPFPPPWSLLPGFKPENNDDRGTLSIVWTCLVTTLLCTYTALHLDVQTSVSTKWSPARRKFRWVVTGIFAPEVITSIAFSQWLYARALVRHMRNQGWSTATMVQAHFLAMRGVNVRNKNYGNGRALLELGTPILRVRMLLGISGSAWHFHRRQRFWIKAKQTLSERFRRACRFCGCWCRL